METDVRIDRSTILLAAHQRARTDFPNMWRTASSVDDEAIASMCLALNAEDPGPDPVPRENVHRTLQVLRAAPHRGRALVLELEGRACGYALLISLWSNELGGEVIEISELYVVPTQRSRGYATALLEELASGASPWTAEVVALALEVSPDNHRARSLYERSGFRGQNVSLRRQLSR